MPLVAGTCRNHFICTSFVAGHTGFANVWIKPLEVKRLWLS